jgi:branched-chain amino acid transport system substrate-binding protein
MKRKFTVVYVALLVALLAMFVCGEAGAQQKGKPIKIGVLGPMSHVSGKYITWSIEMAVEEINEAGGLSVAGVKRPVELVKVDTNELQSVPDAASAVERAITVDKVDFLIGAWRSEAVLAMQDVAMDYKKIMITEGAHPSISKRVKTDYPRYKYWFRAYNNSEDGIPLYFYPLEMMVKKVRKDLKIEKPKVAVMMDKALWTEPMVAVSKPKVSQYGGEYVDLWRPSMTATDMSAELLAVKNKGAHILYVINWGPSGLVLAKQWEELKIPTVLVGAIGETTYSTFWESSRGLGNYSISMGTISRVKINEKTIPFWDKYVKKTGAWPDVFSATFYAAAYRLKEAIEKAGTLEADKLVPVLEKLEYIGPAGKYIVKGMDTDSPHDIAVNQYYTGTACQWQDGQFKTIWPPADGSFHGLVYEGVVEAKLPPWMVKYWERK